METMGLSDTDQYNVISLVAAVLHLGNITFTEENNYASVSNKEC